MQRAAQRESRRQGKERSDVATAAAGKTSTRDRNQRFSKRRGGQDVYKREKYPMPRVARREMSDPANGAAGKTSTSERNERFSERRSGRDVDERT
jgi:hypothetical protein